jgi:O-antigen/teichoic acid export membrane protein
MAIALFIDSFVVLLKYVFQGFGKIIYYSGVDFIRMLLIVTIVFIGFKAGYGIGSPIMAYIITPIVLFVIFSIVLFKTTFPEFFRTKALKWRQLFKTLSEYKINKYSINIMLISAGGMVLGYTDIMVLTYFSGLAAVGLYSIALPTTRVLIYFARAIAGVLLPLSSDLWVKGEKNLLKIGMEELYKYSIIILVPAALTLFSFADIIINIFFGSDYILAATAMRILSIGMIFHIIYSINSDFLSGIGHPHVNSKNIGMAAIFNLIGNLILVPLIGITGAAITTMTSYLIMMIYSTTKIRKFIDVKFPITIWVKVIFIGAVFVLLMGILKRLLELNVWIETGIVLIVSGLCYIILLFAMNVVNQKELKNIYKRIFS